MTAFRNRPYLLSGLKKGIQYLEDDQTLVPTPKTGETSIPIHFPPTSLANTDDCVIEFGVSFLQNCLDAEFVDIRVLEPDPPSQILRLRTQNRWQVVQASNYSHQSR